MNPSFYRFLQSAIKAKLVDLGAYVGKLHVLFTPDCALFFYLC